MTTPAGLDAFRAVDALRDAYLRYYDTAFRLRDDHLQAERRALLEQAGSISAEPYIELRPQYRQVDRDLQASMRDADPTGELGAFTACGLFDRPEMKLYTHQERMLTGTAAPGKNAVVTAGTGSGKTEAFMLPIIADLIRESRSWTGGPAPFDPWWQKSSMPFRSQREGESGHRPKAVRAMVLYPMNALVDDQLVRLRRTLDSATARAWLRENRQGHRFYFGRFTGATPVTGVRPDGAPRGGNRSNGSLEELRKHLSATEARHAKAVEVDRAKMDQQGRQYFVPSMDGAEMRSRWDMYDAPPDILITNYSMLNVMLQRSRDRGFFDSTAEWLDTTPDARFTLVVDELHMYRGTAGTEVAYLIRNLKQRLGLAGHSEKLRVLAASASLDEKRAEDRQFLQEFFAVGKETFEFIPGLPAPRPVGPPAIQTAAQVLAEAAERDLTSDQAAELLKQTGADTAVFKALGGDGTAVAPPAIPATELAAKLFPESSPRGALTALRGAATAIRTATTGEKHARPQLRIHLFFRNVAGIWACTDPTCSAVSAEYASPERRIGRLYTVPRSTCDCGARVLELVYCLSCGEAMLGGYAPRNAFGRTNFSSFLLPDSPDLSRVPDASRSDRTADNYVVYWPTDQIQRADDDGKWTADGGKVTFAFRRSRLEPGSGRLENDGENWTGWSFHVRSQRSRDSSKQPKADTGRIPAFPTRCPCCGADWERTWNPATKATLPPLDPARFVSPIRGMRTGFEKVNQLLADELAEQFRERRDRKLLIFTDSRRDAAKLAPGIALRHYQDLVRLVTLDELSKLEASATGITAVRALANGDKSAEVKDAVAQLEEVMPEAVRELLFAVMRGDEEAVLSAEAQLATAPSLWDLVRSRVHPRLLRLGVNPAGTMRSAQGHNGTDWYSIYDWTGDQPKLSNYASAADKAAAFSSEGGLLENALESLFSGGGRDVESIGLGYISILQAAPDPTSLGQASLRLLAGMRRFNGMDRDPRTKAPSKLRTYWKAVALLRGPAWDEDSVQQEAEKAWGNSVREYLIDPAKVCIRQPGPTMKVCSTCGCRHLTDAADVCIRCHATLPADSAPVERAWEDDYYAWKAHSRRGEFPMNSAELTGQTGRTEAQARQARFQGVFLQDEIEKVHELDLLSVTTTMEAGVDIGPLSAVVMANMPPSRFNYQQRVGRAGRRSSPVAVALTVCRGRSHDEHYFANPDAITNEPTQPPYLTLDRKEIFQRAMTAEVLRLAYAALPAIGGTSNPHGEFGLANSWLAAEPHVRDWLTKHPNEITSAARALTAFTPFEHDSSPDGAWVDHVIKAITNIAAQPVGAQELSERLAHAGILPMFGFPTRVRQLYLERPKRSYPWPPDMTIDRDIAIAVSEFSPGAESIRDGEVYVAVGVTEFEAKLSREPRYIDEPLENNQTVGLCQTCNSIDTTPTGDRAVCKVCGSSEYTVVDLREPAGFRARYDRDFDGNFTWSPRTVTSRASVNLPDLTRNSWHEADVYAGPATRYVINDNGGKLFSFRRATGNWGGYIATTSVDQTKGFGAHGDPFEVALSARLQTDFLFIGPQATTDAERGLRLNFTQETNPLYAQDLSEGRRAAWYSLAFLLRAAAALHLDMARQELVAGVHTGPHSDGHAMYAFLADSLENGAGFSTHLGTSPGLAPFMDDVTELIMELRKPGHAGICKSSCPRCLRDYSNMAVHPLLDWRLAADLLEVLRSSNLPDDAQRGARSLSALQSLFGGEVLLEGPTAMLQLTYRREPWVVIAKHPLEACEGRLVSPRLDTALNAARAHTQNASRVLVADWFTLEKSPVRILDCLEAARRR